MVYRHHLFVHAIPLKARIGTRKPPVTIGGFASRGLRKEPAARQLFRALWDSITVEQLKRASSLCIVIGSCNFGGLGEEVSDSDIVDVIARYGGDDNDSRSGARAGCQQSSSG